MPKTAALLLTLGLISMGLVALTIPARAANVSLNLYGAQFAGWGTTSTSESSPGPDLHVNPGDAVTITLHSTDGVAHQFFVDLNNNHVPDAGEPTSSVFSTTATVNFTAPAAGTYHYYCYFHEPAMYGILVVGSAGAPSSSGGTSGAGIDPLVIGGVVVVVVALAAVGIVLLRRKK